MLLNSVPSLTFSRVLRHCLRCSLLSAKTLMFHYYSKNKRVFILELTLNNTKIFCTKFRISAMHPKVGNLRILFGGC